MKQIISFEKEIPFKTMIGEITSISLEHTLAFENDTTILGDFIVSGSYKMTEASRLDEPFSYKVPVDIELTSSLEENSRRLEIENFTYEILDDEALLVKIDLLVEGLEKIVEEEESVEVLEEETEEVLHQEDSLLEQEPIVEEETIVEEVRESVLETEPITVLEEQAVIDAQESIDKVNSVTPLKEEIVEEKVVEVPPKEVINSIFSVFKDTEETFATYSVYILRQDDTIDEVLNRYGVSREEAAKYNQLEELKVGSKLILPTVISNE